MKKEGSLIVLILWVILFWPIAIWYWFNRVWPKEKFTSNLVSQKEIDKANAEKDEQQKKKDQN